MATAASAAAVAVAPSCSHNPGHVVACSAYLHTGNGVVPATCHPPRQAQMRGNAWACTDQQTTTSSVLRRMVSASRVIIPSWPVLWFCSALVLLCCAVLCFALRCFALLCIRLLSKMVCPRVILGNTRGVASELWTAAGRGHWWGGS